MNTQTKQKFIVTFPKSKSKKTTFFELARKHTSKKTKEKRTHISRDIDKILYGT